MRHVAPLPTSTSMTNEPASPFFNAHHAPVGAFSTFTLGFPGPKGGLGLELGGPANESVFIGLETHEGGSYEALPFFANSASAAKRYDVAADAPQEPQGRVRAFPAGAITRDFGAACDTWRAGDLVVRDLFPASSLSPTPRRRTRRR